MDIEDFCIKLSGLDLSQPQQGLAILWFEDNRSAGTSITPGQIAKCIRESGLGSPHSTRLGESILKTKHALKAGAKLKIKPTSRETVGSWVSSILKPEPPSVDHETGYIPKSVWDGTRGYIAKIAIQINGCYEHAFFDGASVLVRRLVETLLIECYEHLGIESQIQDADGNYPMLSEIILGAVDHGHLALGREAKKVLKEIRTAGNRSAHSRRYNAERADLDKLENGVRLVVDELLNLAGLK